MDSKKSNIFVKKVKKINEDLKKAGQDQEKTNAIDNLLLFINKYKKLSNNKNLSFKGGPVQRVGEEAGKAAIVDSTGAGKVVSEAISEGVGIIAEAIVPGTGEPVKQAVKPPARYISDAITWTTT